MRQKERHSIAISGFFGDDNVGDDLLQIALIKGIWNYLRNCQISIFTSNVRKNIALFKREKIDHKNCEFIYSGRWGLKEPEKRGLRAFIWLFKNVLTLRKCDIHLIGPGNLLKDNTNKFLATFWILRGALSYLVRKPFAFFAIGVADVYHFHSKLLIKNIVNKALLITTRDNTSLKKLNQLNVNKPLLASFPDLTYTLINEKKTKYCDKTGEIRKIGINLANFSLKFFPYQVIENYKKVILEFLKKITKENKNEYIYFTFSYQDHFNDHIIYEYVSSDMKKYHQHIHNYSYKNINDLKEEISTCDAFVGTRFHSVLFAIQECVPTVALTYDWKGKNFLVEAGIGNYALEVKWLSLSKLLDAWDDLRSNYMTYFSHLKQLNQSYYSLSLKHFDTLKKCL